jgi:hypothetical protein
VTAPTIELVEQVRHALATAREAGEPAPGRPSLAKSTGATEYQVRQALTVLANEDTAPVPPLTPGVPAVPSSVGTSARLPRPWPLVFIGLAAAVAVWGGWVRLGELTGFGPMNLLPGIGPGFVLNTAVVLPLSVEAYAAYALHVLLSAAWSSARTHRFARWSVVTSLVVGGGGAQVASHVMAAAGVTSAPWWVTTVVATVPVLVVGLATGLATLVRQDARAGGVQ